MSEVIEALKTLFIIVYCSICIFFPVMFIPLLIATYINLRRAKRESILKYETRKQEIVSVLVLIASLSLGVSILTAL